MENEGLEKRFLTFLSDGLTFAVSTDHVVEIITNYMIREVPLVPEYVTGIINLRGQVIPVINIRKRMGKADETFPTTCIIILEIDSSMIGVIVDSVSQVIEIDSSLASTIPVANRLELTDRMISLGDGNTALFLNCESLVHA